MFFFPLGDDVNKRNFPVVGYVLITINILVYLYMHRLWNMSAEQHTPVAYVYKYSPYDQFILTWGCRASNLRTGHVMCAMTAMFLHANLLHILGNMMMLWVFVGTLENAFTQAKFMFCYLIWGVVASLTQVAMDWKSDVPNLGASGAIAGMIGAYWVAFGALTRIRVLVFFFTYPKIIYVPSGLFILLWVMSQLAGVLDDRPTAPIAWYAHIGGFAAGTATMLLLRKEVMARLKRDEDGSLEVSGDDLLEAAPQPVRGLGEGKVPLKTKKLFACPQCGTSFAKAQHVSGSLWRCANPVCQKLIYRE